MSMAIFQPLTSPDRNYAQSKTSDSDFRLESESREYTCTPAVCLQTNSTFSREYILFPARLLFSISFYF